MKKAPQSAWDRDPEGTYRMMTGLLEEDIKNGYVIGDEIKLFRRAINMCYLKAKKRNRD